MNLHLAPQCNSRSRDIQVPDCTVLCLMDRRSCGASPQRRQRFYGKIRNSSRRSPLFFCCPCEVLGHPCTSTRNWFIEEITCTYSMVIQLTDGPLAYLLHNWS